MTSSLAGFGQGYPATSSLVRFGQGYRTTSSPCRISTKALLLPFHLDSLWLTIQPLDVMKDEDYNTNELSSRVDINLV